MRTSPFLNSTSQFSDIEIWLWQTPQDAQCWNIKFLPAALPSFDRKGRGFPRVEHSPFLERHGDSELGQKALGILLGELSRETYANASARCGSKRLLPYVVV